MGAIISKESTESESFELLDIKVYLKFGAGYPWLGTMTETEAFTSTWNALSNEAIFGGVDEMGS